MKLILCDTAPEVIGAWQTQFLKRPEVEVRPAACLEAEADAFLLPGNSFGFLDGGLALTVLERFGWEVESEIRARIRLEHDGELLVGAAVVIRAPSLPRALVYSPLYRTPRKVEGTMNAFLCARGAFFALQRDKGSPPIASIAVPPLGCGEGGMDPRISARQVRYAYEIATGQRGFGDKNLTQQVRRERKLLLVPGLARAEGDAKDGSDED